MEDKIKIEDLPDEWYEIVRREGEDFLNKIDIYPVELNLIIIQAVLQTYIYSVIQKEFRQTLLVQFVENALEAFEMWDVEDQFS